MNLYRTYQPKAKEIKRSWHLFDAKGRVLGRLATQIARVLMGKHKKTYVPHLDCGDFAVVINAKDIAVTGKKEKQKMYYSHSGYPGGLKARRLEELRERSPKKIIEFAVWNMLPKNRLRKDRMARLKVFAGEEQPYKGKFQNSNIKNQNDISKA